MNLKQAEQEAMAVRALYEKLEQSLYGRSWTTEEIALGFMGDVGDLMKLIQAEEGVRNISGHKEKLAHELSDCLWSIFVLANRCGVDLESEFGKSMEALRHRVSNQLAAEEP